MIHLVSPLLTLRDFTVELPTPNGWVRPVDGVSLAIERGSALGLVGESGSGKTMLSLALMGLLPPGARTRGKALLGGNGASATDLTKLTEHQWIALRGRRIAMVFQEPMTALNPVMRIGAQVAEAIRAHHPELSGLQLSRAVREALERAAVPEPDLRAAQYPHELSGGLRQRVMIAMALAGGGDEKSGEPSARLLIADEPTTALDVTVQKQMLDLLARLRRELGLTLVFITHDLGVVAQVAERIAVLYAGRIVEHGPTAEVLRSPRHPYTAGLLSASPRLEKHAIKAIPGMVPALDDLPHGCAFSPRCPVRIEACDEAMPELRDAGAKHQARCVLV